MTDRESQDLVNRAGLNLGEHFESVVVLASFTENGFTYMKKIVIGNWHAGQGMAHEFITMAQSELAADEIRKAFPPAPDDGDEWKE